MLVVIFCDLWTEPGYWLLPVYKLCTKLNSSTAGSSYASTIKTRECVLMQPLCTKAIACISQNVELCLYELLGCQWNLWAVFLTLAWGQGINRYVFFFFSQRRSIYRGLVTKENNNWYLEMINICSKKKQKEIDIIISDGMWPTTVYSIWRYYVWVLPFSAT